MKELVEYLVKALVDHPEEVALDIREDEDQITMEVRVAADDFGKVIGKGGYTINAIRTVAQAAASSHKKRLKLDVIN